MKCRRFQTKHSLSSPKSAVEVSLLVQKSENHHVWLLEKCKWDCQNCKKIYELSKGKKKLVKSHIRVAIKPMSTQK